LGSVQRLNTWFIESVDRRAEMSGRLDSRSATTALANFHIHSCPWLANDFEPSSSAFSLSVILKHLYGVCCAAVRVTLGGDSAWNPLGQPTAWTWAFANPTLAASRSYDTAGRMTATAFSSYVYDAAGRITSLTQQLYAPGDTDPTHSTISASDITWTVGYNAVGRITGFNASGSTAGFGYDANGNRSSSTRVLGTQSTSRTYTVGATSNRLTGFSQSINGASSTSVSYGYDANGDLVSDGLRSYTYDAEGRLAAATTGATDVSPTTRYAHNAPGQRLFKTEPLYPPGQGDEADPGFMQSLIAFFTKLWNPTVNQAEQLGYAYVYDENGTLISEAGSGGGNSAGQASYIYLPTANGPMPIVAVINSATYAVHSDHLNTPRRLSNDSGQAVWQWSYSAFGEDKPTIARNRFANLDTTPNPGITSVSEVKFNLRYPGQYADEESGLFYNYFRSYDARTGRYSQADPIGLEGEWNRFGYVDGNPLSYVDPDGLVKIGRKLIELEPLDGGGGGGIGGGGARSGLSCPPVTSRIKESPRLVKEAEKAGKSNQDGIDRLMEQIRRGNTNPGLGSEPIGDGLSEARGRDGSPVYFRETPNGIEILGKSNKDNQPSVIGEVRRIFGRKK
jgi:RHS repeat-associated protein